MIVRGDSGFCRNELLSWCESQAVPVAYVVGVARAIRAITEKPARAFAGLRYQTLTGSWSRERRVVGKAEALCGELVAGERVGRAGSVRGFELCARGNGESDQGAVVAVCGPGERGDDECQSVTGVLSGDGICVDQRVATDRIGEDGDGAVAGDDDSFAAAEDWCAGEDYGAADVGAFVRGVSVAGGVLACGGATALRKSGRRGSESEEEKAEGVRRAKEVIGARLEPRHAIAGPPKRLDKGVPSRFPEKGGQYTTFCVKAGCWVEMTVSP